MYLKTIVVVPLKVALLGLLSMVCSGLAYRIFGPPAPPPSAADASRILLAMFADSLFLAAVVTLLVSRSRWRGLKLVSALVGTLFVVRTFQPLIEAALYPAALVHLPPGAYRASWLSGFCHFALFIPLAVAALGRLFGSSEPSAPWPPSPPRIGTRLGICAVLYVALYWSFGYCVAWQAPEVRAFYGNVVAIVPLWPWMHLIQLGRGLLWTLIALAVVRFAKGGRVETALSVGLLFTTMAVQLVIPGPHMPPAVRMAHLAETAPSNFLFGCLAAWILQLRTHAAHAGLGRRSPTS